MSQCPLLSFHLFFALRAASPNAQATRVAPAVPDIETIDIVDSDTEFTTCNIEDIQAGDLVLARDEHGHDIGLKPVKEVYKRTSYHLRHLTFESADGNQQTISTTDEHPFWSVTADEFLETCLLPVGHQVTDPHGKTQGLVSSTREEFPNGIPVFNFQVEDFHTYYVAAHAGDDVLLVHNADYSDLPDLVPIHGLKKEVTDFWIDKPTEKILASLKEGDEVLVAFTDGRILNGHHRLSILESRGIDINSLPRVIRDPFDALGRPPGID